jgi:hypothetical protein
MRAPVPATHRPPALASVPAVREEDAGRRGTLLCAFHHRAFAGFVIVDRGTQLRAWFHGKVINRQKQSVAVVFITIHLMQA